MRGVAADNRGTSASALEHPGPDQALHDLFRTGKINGEKLQDPEAWKAQLQALAKENPLNFTKLIKDLKKPSLFVQYIEMFKAGLVSGPQTQIVNAISPAVFNAWRLLEEVGTGLVDRRLWQLVPSAGGGAGPEDLR